MISRLALQASPGRLVIALSAMLLLASIGRPAEARHGGKRKGAVWVVFFSSKDCPKCAHVNRLIHALARRYPLRIRKYGIEKPKNYDLFEKLEAIHSDDGFAVPLVILGETILMGEGAISEHLEGTIRRLVAAGGAPAPYMGRKLKKKRKRGKAERKPGKTRSKVAGSSSDCNCDRRPPSIGEELKKVRGLLRGLL
jgi:thiol-disulfide isomerase/thioredoxin